MKRWKIILAFFLTVVILLAAVIFYFYLPENPENNSEYKVTFSATAELRKTDNWRFHVNFKMENKGNVTLNILWCWFNATKIGYPTGTLEDLGITGNFTELLIIEPTELKTLDAILTEFGFSTEPSELWGDVLIRIAENQDPIPFSFHISVEEGTITRN